MSSDTFVIVTVHNEAERIGATLTALGLAFPGASVWVAADGSTDATPEIAREAGARVVRSGRVIGKGAAATLAAREALRSREAILGGEAFGGDIPDGEAASGATGTGGEHGETVCVLCDGDLRESARGLPPLAQAVRSGQADIAVAVFARPLGGGIGLAVTFARWAIRRRCGLRTRAPICGQRALRARTLEDVLPFAQGFGMEVGMTIDAVRAGQRVTEIELDLSHRATGRTPAGFAHRARQLVDFVRVYAARA
jgi:glycosyltransferase involved in cell wall biosynthesis